MDWSDEFFTQRRLTSKLKHLVLERYVKEFAYHLGSALPVVYYVDGFAGAGAYSRGTTKELGSPLLIAKMAEEAGKSARPFKLRCLNVESNRRRFNSLEQATLPFCPQIVEKNYHSHFADAIPDILSRVATGPAFFFIDPFGTKDIPFDSLVPIFRRSRTTEVLITLHTDGIAKKAGWFARERSADFRERSLAMKFTDHLAAALGASKDQLRAAWSETGAKGDTTAFENRALWHYLRRLRSERVGFKFTKTFKVLYYRPHQPFKEVPACFHLVFATKHEQGLFKMNDAMADALEEFYQEIYGGTATECEIRSTKSLAHTPPSRYPDLDARW